MALFGRKKPEDAFADELAKLSRSLLGATVVKRDDFALELTLPGDDEVRTFFLTNVFQECQGLSGEERAGRLRTAVLAMNPPPRPTTWEEARSRLLPAVRARSWTAVGGDTLVTQPFLPLLDLLVALDSEHALSYVTKDDLARWSVTPEEVVAEAMANFSGHAIPHLKQAGLYALVGPDGYASSWLVSPQRLARLGDDLDPPLVVLAPSRDDVWLLSASSPGLAQALKAAEEVFLESPRKLSPRPYLVDGDALSPWDPDDASAVAVARNQALLELVEYQDQKARLEAADQEAAVDRFVASYTLMDGPAGSAWSWSSWVRQVSDGLLPQTTYVVLGDLTDKGAQLVVTWEDALRLAGDHLLPVPDLDPPRWRYTGWPSEEALTQLRACATALPS